MHKIPENHQLYLMGDYHSNPEILSEVMQEMQQPASLVILGDYDAHEAQDIVNLSVLAEHHGVAFYLMRGNHDNPSYWQNRELSDVLETEWLKLLNDVDLLLWRELRLITVSGAVSVDRKGVRFDDGHCWPEQEGISKQAIAQVQELGAADILLTHTGIIDGMTAKNDFAQSYASLDDRLSQDLEAERKLVQQLQIASCCKNHYFGHFHQSWKGCQFGVDVRCLSICEIKKL